MDAQGCSICELILSEGLEPPTPAAAWLLKPLVGFLKSVSTFNIFNPANIESADTSDQFAQISWSHNSPTWFIYASFSQEDHFCCCDSSNFASFACPRWVWIVLRVSICVLIMPCRHCKDSWPRRPPKQTSLKLTWFGITWYKCMDINEVQWISMNILHWRHVKLTVVIKFAETRHFSVRVLFSLYVVTPASDVTVVWWSTVKNYVPSMYQMLTLFRFEKL